MTKEGINAQLLTTFKNGNSKYEMENSKSNPKKQKQKKAIVKIKTINILNPL